MSEFERKKLNALRELEKSSMRSRNYLPPMFPFLWRRGINIRPPHYLPFVWLFLIMGVPFGFSALGFHVATNDGNTELYHSLAITIFFTIFLVQFSQHAILWLEKYIDCQNGKIYELKIQNIYIHKFPINLKQHTKFKNLTNILRYYKFDKIQPIFKYIKNKSSIFE